MRPIFTLRAIACMIAAPLGFSIGVLAAVVVAGVPTAVAVKAIYQGTRPTAYVTWTDTNTTVIRTEIQRRSTGSDTIWRRVGSNSNGKLTSFYDPYVLPNRKYIYRVRDSVPGAALTAWSDTGYATMTKLP